MSRSKTFWGPLKMSISHSSSSLIQVPISIWNYLFKMWELLPTKTGLGCLPFHHVCTSAHVGGSSHISNVQRNFVLVRFASRLMTGIQVSFTVMNTCALQSHKKKPSTGSNGLRFQYCLQNAVRACSEDVNESVDHGWHIIPDSSISAVITVVAPADGI